MQVFFIALIAELLKRDWDVPFSVSKIKKTEYKKLHRGVSGFDLVLHEGSQPPAFDDPDKHPENSTPPAVTTAL